MAYATAKLSTDTKEPEAQWSAGFKNFLVFGDFLQI